MEREIKFRAWNEIKNTMLSWEKIKHNSHMDLVGNYFFVFNRNEYKLMQYTGLKDKNKKDIYEGDVDSRGFIVEYLLGMSGFYLMKNGEGVHLSHEQSVLHGQLKHIEIIGNIWENPELLKDPS